MNLHFREELRKNVIKEIIYNIFDNILSDSNESFNVPFGFAGGLYDEDTGLTRFGYRDYDSYTGKWTAKDPIDFSGGDTNLYGYVFNDPVNFLDVDGLCPLVLIPATELALITSAALAAGLSAAELYNIIKNSMKNGESFNDAYNNYINSKKDAFKDNGNYKTPSEYPDDFESYIDGKRSKHDKSYWEKDTSSHGGKQYKRWPNFKDKEKGKKPNSIWEDGRVRK